MYMACVKPPTMGQRSRSRVRNTLGQPKRTRNRGMYKLQEVLSTM